MSASNEEHRDYDNSNSSRHNHLKQCILQSVVCLFVLCALMNIGAHATVAVAAAHCDSTHTVCTLCSLVAMRQLQLTIFHLNSIVEHGREHIEFVQHTTRTENCIRLVHDAQNVCRPNVCTAYGQWRNALYFIFFVSTGEKHAKHLLHNVAETSQWKEFCSFFCLRLFCSVLVVSVDHVLCVCVHCRSD